MVNLFLEEHLEMINALLKHSKATSQRLKDMADVEELQRIKKYRNK